MSDAMTNDSGKPRLADPRWAGGAYGPQVHGAAYACPRSFQPPKLTGCVWSFMEVQSGSPPGWT